VEAEEDALFPQLGIEGLSNSGIGEFWNLGILELRDWMKSDKGRVREKPNVE